MNPNETVNPSRRDWLSLVITILALVYVVGVTFVIQAFALLAATTPYEFLQREVSAPMIYFIAAVLQCVLLLVVLTPLAVWWRAPRYRAAFRAWALAALFLLVLAPTRLVPSTYPQIALLLQFLLAGSWAVAVWFFTGRGAWLERAPAGAALAVALGILLSVPWLVWGALGSIGDVLLGILAALAFACAGTFLIARVWLRGMARDARGAGWDTTLGGFVVGAVLLVMGSAIGFGGTQIWFMVALAAFGWMLMGLALSDAQTWARGNEFALFVLLACGAGAPYLFLDPNAGILLAALGDGEVLTYVVRATAVVILAAWSLGIVLFLLRQRVARASVRAPVWTSAGVLAVVAASMYFVWGQPGFFGDRVFVIMKSQADVSSAKNIAAYDERRAFVYNTLTQHAAQTQSDLRASLDAFGISYTPYYLENALEVNADLPMQWWLASRQDVARVLPSPHMRPLPEALPISRGTETSAPQTPEWNLTLIGADRVWNELHVRGQGIVVGQSDSGVDGAHSELREQYRGRSGSNDYAWLDPWNHSASPQDFGGHGTHTLGSVLGKNVGVAPDAEWIACVNLARNLGNPALYLDCMQFNFAPYPQNGDALRDGKPNLGAHVLNNSWGCPDVEGCDANALLPAVRALRDAGVFVVASAGNDGPACSSINAPLSLYDDVFSVAAVNRNKHVADFSSRGPVLADNSGRVKPDIGAPGMNVLSALPGGTYGENSGTSMAGPHIVGVVALMWSANPKLIGDIDTTEQIIRETAQPASVAGEKIVCGDPNATPNDFVGYGIVDAYAAVQRALAEK